MCGWITRDVLASPARNVNANFPSTTTPKSASALSSDLRELAPTGRHRPALPGYEVDGPPRAQRRALSSRLTWRGPPRRAPERECLSPHSFWHCAIVSNRSSNSTCTNTLIRTR